MQPPYSRLKITLRVVTMVAVVLFIVLQIVVRLPPTIRLKPESELAKLTVISDSYPCLLVERQTPSGPLSASIRQCLPALDNDAEVEQYEIDLRSGLFILRKTDLFVSDSMPLALTRAYRLWDNRPYAFGVGGNHSYDIYPTGDHFPYTYMNLNLADGTAIRYDRISQGTSYADFLAEHIGTPVTPFQKSRVQWRGDHWELTLHGGTLINLPDSYQATRAAAGAPTAIRNEQGELVRLLRDSQHNLTTVTSPHNRHIHLRYDSDNRVIEAADDDDHAVYYSYDAEGRLAEVRQRGLLAWRYLYDSTGMVQVQDALQRALVTNQYSRGRIATLTLGSGATYRFDYLVAANGKVAETLVTDPAGKVATFTF